MDADFFSYGEVFQIICELRIRTIEVSMSQIEASTAVTCSEILFIVDVCNLVKVPLVGAIHHA